MNFSRHNAQAFCVKLLSVLLSVTLVFPPNLYAQSVVLPPVGSIVNPTSTFHPVNVKGLTVHPENPFQFEFILDPGDAEVDQGRIQSESMKMIKYFLTTLTVPDNEMWVNLSPIEKDRIIADGLGQTVMGKDLLTLDYMLKQLTASLMNPETESGKKFWDKVYENVETQNFASLRETIQSFNKVWIVPSKASIYQRGASALIVENRLKVMLEEDYFMSQGYNVTSSQAKTNDIKNIIRETIIPIIEKEVNEGETFANLRQIYNAMLLATWYKRNLKKSLLAQVYVDQNKVQGVESGDEQAVQNIYDQYVASFKAGAANIIKEEYDAETQQAVTRQYFTGGLKSYEQVAISAPSELNFAQLVTADDFVASFSIDPGNYAMLFNPEDPYPANSAWTKNWQDIISMSSEEGETIINFNLNQDKGSSVWMRGNHIKDIQDLNRENAEKFEVTVSPALLQALRDASIPLNIRINSEQMIIFIEDPEWPSEYFFRASQRLADLFNRIKSSGIDLNKVAENLKKNNVVFVEMLRDALQNLQGKNISIDQRWQMIQAYLSAGIKNIEYAVHSQLMPDAPQMGAYLADKDIPEDVNLMELVFNERGVRAALANPKIKTVAFNASASPKYGEDNYGESDLEKWIDGRVVPLVGMVQADPRNLDIRIYISHVWGYEKDPNYLTPDVDLIIRIVQKFKNLGVRTIEIALSDTTGKATAQEVKEVFDQVLAQEKFEGLKIGFHGHDRDGNGLVNALAAVEAGVHFIDASTANMGGSPHLEGTIPGNVPMEDLVFFAENLKAQMGVQPDNYLNAGRFVLGLVGEDSRGSQMIGLHNLKDFEIRMLQRQFDNEFAVTKGQLREVNNAMFATQARERLDQIFAQGPSLHHLGFARDMDAWLDENLSDEKAAVIDQENSMTSGAMAEFQTALHQPIKPNGPRIVGIALSQEYQHPDYRGPLLGTMGDVIATMKIAAASEGPALTVDVKNDLTAFPVNLAGTPEQKAKYLVPHINGERTLCYGLTEPRSGSDAVNMETTAEYDPETGEFTIHGMKRYITNGQEATHVIVFAEVTVKGRASDPNIPKSKRIGAFIVSIESFGENGGRLVERTHLEMKTHRGSGTTEFQFNGVKVKEEDVLGDIWIDGQGNQRADLLTNKDLMLGSTIFLKTLEAGRISISSIALGAQWRTLQELINAYEKLGVQSVEWERAIEEMTADFEAGWQMIQHVSRLKEDKKPYNFQAGILKLVTSEAAVRNTKRAMLLIGDGEARAVLERLHRDNKLLTIGEGSTQTMRGGVVVNELSRKYQDKKSSVIELLKKAIDEQYLIDESLSGKMAVMFEQYEDEKDGDMREVIQWQIVDMYAAAITWKVLQSVDAVDSRIRQRYEQTLDHMPADFLKYREFMKQVFKRKVVEGATNDWLMNSTSQILEALSREGVLWENMTPEDAFGAMEMIKESFVASTQRAVDIILELAREFARTRDAAGGKHIIDFVQVRVMLLQRAQQLVDAMTVEQDPEDLADTLMEIADVLVQTYGGAGLEESEVSNFFVRAAALAPIFVSRMRELEGMLNPETLNIFFNDNPDYVAAMAEGVTGDVNAMFNRGYAWEAKKPAPKAEDGNKAMLTFIDKKKPVDLVSDFVTYLMDNQPDWWAQDIKELNDTRIGLVVKVPNRQSGAQVINLQIGDRYHVFQMIESSKETVYTIFDASGQHVAQGVYEGALNNVVRVLVRWAQEEGRKDADGERNTKDGYIEDLLQQTGLNNAMLNVDPIAYPKEAVLEGKVVALQGIGGVGGLLVAPLLNAGVKVIASDIDPGKVAQYQETFADFIQSGQLFVFVEDKIASGYTSKIVNPLKYFPELKEVMGIDSVDVFAPSAAGRVLNDQTIPELKDAGVKAVVGSANDVFLNRQKHSQDLHEAGILVVPDYIANFGGVFGVDAFLLNTPVTNALVVETARLNVSSLLEGSKGQAPLAVADQKARAFFDALPRKTDKTDALALNGHRFEDGTVVKVYASPDGLPAQVRDRWDDHYAVFELRNEVLGYVSYVSIHRLTQIQGQVEVLKNQFRATGGTRIRNYAADEDALADALELSKEMSFKTAGASLPIGGSKCTINVTIDPRYNGPDQEKRKNIITSYAQAIEYIGEQIGGGVLTGQDMNISVADAKLMFESAPTSIVPYVAGQFSIEPTPPTSVGVYNAIVATVMHLADAAALVTPGGIDLDGSKLDLDILGDGTAMEWKIDPAILERFKSMEFKGFNPVILQIQPIVNTPLYSELTGEAPQRAADEDQVEMSLSYLKED